MPDYYSGAYTGAQIDAGIAAANAAAPQSTTYTKSEVDSLIPTSAADVNALPSSTKYGSSLTMTINSSTFVVTVTLKDQDGNTLGVVQTIDLPLETMVVDGAYDAQTEKIILTLKNGNTVEFSVAALVSGLQSEITAQNKLSADLVDDTTSTHKFVTSADKTAWNAKSDFSGSYNDLTNKPTIPAAQVSSDWNASSGVAQILNKPTLGTAAAANTTTSITSGGTGLPTSDTVYSVTGDKTSLTTTAKATLVDAINELNSNKITAASYATQNTGGTVKVWTTTDGTDTILHIATQ